MMKGISLKRSVSLIVIVIIASSFCFALPQKAEAKTPLLKLKANNPYRYYLDILDILSDQLRVIGIDLEVSWIDHFSYLYFGYSGDISMSGLNGWGIDPDFTGVYNENGSLNILFNYRTDMDWDEELGTGKNEWYLKYGRQMTPPYSEERIQHYWNWEQYMMDELLIMQPLFTRKEYETLWSNLAGYNISDEILQSWGKMDWLGSHAGQTNTDEVVIVKDPWRGYNQIDKIDWKDSAATEFLLSLCLDPLIWYDPDSSVKPHLAEEYVYLDNTTIEITCRQEVKWAADPDGNFTDEYFDVDDLIFTLFVMKNLSYYKLHYDWIDSWEKIDNYTLRINIDEGYLNDYHQFYSGYFSSLSTSILPEHYLNQTQLVDGITPNSTHLSWEIFEEKPFGTGLFEISEFDENIGMNLTTRPDCWWRNTSITNDPDLDWENRFGDFSGGITNLRIRYIEEELVRLLEFEAGKLDIFSGSVPWEDYYINPLLYDYQDKLSWHMNYFGYNCRSTLATGNREPCEKEPTISKGFALRKAISYAMDRVEINNIMNGGRHKILDYPIYERLTIWCNPNIIRYDHDLEKARYYMELLGYDTASEVVGINSYQIISVSFSVLFVLVIFRWKINKKGKK